MFFTFDLCLLLYVIRLAGWLKHCNLSLSLSTLAPRIDVTRRNLRPAINGLCKLARLLVRVNEDHARGTLVQRACARHV